MMMKVLQINIGVGRAAQDLALATATEMKAIILIVNEQIRDRGEDPRWYTDTSGRSAIAIMGDTHVDQIGPPTLGTRWIEFKGFRFYSGNCSLKVSFQVFETFLDRLEVSDRGATYPVIVAGDFNSNLPEWGRPLEDRRGKTLTELAESLGLATCNQGNDLTFIRGASRFHLDLTLVTQAAASKISSWTVMQEESFSSHKYIMFDVDTQNGLQRKDTWKGWAYRKLDYQRLENKLQKGVPSPAGDAATACKNVIFWLSEACISCMPHSSSRRNNRSPVPWWNPAIAEHRKLCIKARRAYTRKVKKAGEAGSLAERQTYKDQRKALTIQIFEAKEKNWNTVCAKVTTIRGDCPTK